MDFQSLCEIADRELNAGLADPDLIAQALAEAKGVEAQARQIFWHRRATQLSRMQELHGETAIQTVLAELQSQENRLRTRKNFYRWFWALACVVGLLGATLFSWFAFAAMEKPGPRFLILFVLAIASSALALLARRASRYHTHVE